jgi:putative addiction module component (TIGR02574 family)
MLNRDQVLEQALALGPDDRAVVVEALEQSLPDQGFANHEIAAAWAAEIERRAAAVERGEMPTEDWRAVIARLRGQGAPLGQPS